MSLNCIQGCTMDMHTIIPGISEAPVHADNFSFQGGYLRGREGRGRRPATTHDRSLQQVRAVSAHVERQVLG